ncbi:MAG: FAD-binding oxidoreductase [Clostridiales bacterium]|nr:FAD-binding oxidoreductase [Clostridiales bacterium]
MDRNYMHSMILSEFADVVGQENVHTSQAEKIAHSVDYYWVPRVWADRGRLTHQPDFIVYPETTEQVAAIVRIAGYYKMPLVTWGGGAGSQGGALPTQGGIILDTKRMNKVLEVNEIAHTVTAQTGIIHQDLEWEVNRHNLSTMHFPASISCSTLGGFLAHRGTGTLSTKYGKMEDLIISLEAVLPNGEIIETPPVPRHSSGPDLNQLFVGSEGTLGIMTKATIKLFPVPEERRFRAFMFRNNHDALDAGRRIMVNRLQPAVIRVYDENETVHQIKKVLGIDRTGAYLVYGFEGYKDIVEIQERIAAEICLETATEDLGPRLGESWWENRYKFYYPPYIMDLPEAFGTMDVVATYDKIENVYYKMKEHAESFPGTHFIAHFSHWYDWGCMMYDRFIIHPDYVPADPDEATRLYNRIWNECMHIAVDNGALLNEHHGIGLKLTYAMREMYGTGFKVLQTIKKSLDPDGIMNPGKLGL